MFDRLKSALHALRFVSDAERERDYLNQSISLADLERRQREVERGLFRDVVYG